jgi:uncharacterized protein YybS (DUF2232 family)
VTSTAETPRTASFLDAARSVGALLLGAGLIAFASSDLPAPLPWAYGLLPIAMLWLSRRVGLLLGALAATSTLGAVYAAGMTEPHQLLFVAVLAGAGLSFAASTRRGATASTALFLALVPVLAVAAGYLALGGLEELHRLLAERIEEVRRLEMEHRVSQALGLSAAEFDRALEQTGKTWTLLLPSLFALKWVLVLAINCWLASVLFQDGEGFPYFAEFSTWRVHSAGAWAMALAMALLVSRVKPAVEAGWNIVFPLALAYTIQGLAVARFVAIAFEIRAVIQAAIVILVVCMPILLVVFFGIGFFDAWYDFRRRVLAGLVGPLQDDESGRGET